MADSVKTTIVNSVVAAIGAIAAGATYTRTVRACTRNVRTIAQSTLFDAVWVERTSEAKVARNDVTHVTLTILLGVIVQAYDNLGAAVDALCADIEKALSVDITRGGYALDTRVVAFEEAVSEDMEPLGGGYVTVEVTYRHADGDPYTKR